MKRLLVLLLLPSSAYSLKIYPPFYDSYKQCRPTPLVSTAECGKAAYENRSTYRRRNDRYKVATTKNQTRRTIARTPR